jgi:Ca2+-binding EF-hand superfamily protein
MRATLYLTLGLTALVLWSAPAPAQFPQGGGGRGGGGGGRGGGFGGGGGFRFDPNQMFDRMANGKSVLVRSELTDPRSQAMFDRWAQRLGVNNGQITREQFTTMMQQRGPGGGPGNPGSPGGPGADRGPGGRGNGGGNDGNNADRITTWAENMFRRYDANGDGLLNSDEMPEDLKSERDKWDTNKDGFIDLTEFKAYFQARVQQFQADRNAAGNQNWWSSVGGVPGVVPPEAAPEEEDKKPTVYRAGKLPKNLPPWFEQLDTDKDGQIGLYEWKSSGRPIEEFLKMDRNNDGFLTAEEVLYYQSNQGKKNGQSGDSPSGFNGFQDRTSNYPGGTGGNRGGRGGGRGPRARDRAG